MLLKKLYLPLSSLLIIIFFAGCSKYPDGPSFSLRSTTDRIGNQWVPGSIDSNGIDVTASYEDFLLEIGRSGELTWNYIYDEDTISREGNWQFINNSRDIEVNFINGPTEEWAILRLKRDELWLDREKDTISWEFRLVPE